MGNPLSRVAVGPIDGLISKGFCLGLIYVALVGGACSSSSSSPTGSGGNSGSGGSAHSGTGGAVDGEGGVGGAAGMRGVGGVNGSGGSVGGASGAKGSGGVMGTGGSPATGGSSGSGGTAVGGSSGQAGTFTLAWQDDFNTLDTSAWQLESFSYDGNLAQFSPQNASVTNGILTLNLTPAPSDPVKPYRGVEMRSSRTLTYGKVSARMRFAKGSGVVSGLVLFYTPFPNCDWNEIDVEHLGKTSNSSQLNAMVFVGTPVANCATSVTPTQDPLIVDLGIDAEADFHQYDIEWTPAGVSFFVDGGLLRTWTQRIALMRLPQNVLLTIWASSAADWAGPLAPTPAPTSASVDWIKVYNWQP